jgi:HSP20 family protein
MLARWEPFRELARVFDDPFYRVLSGGDGTCRWCPAVDVSEDAKEILVSADLPGVEPKEVEITVKENVLTLSGERKTEKEEKDEQEGTYHRVERTTGAFSRSFVLPSTVDETKVSAEYKDGVLRVHLPKREEVQPRKIQIKSN